MTNGFQSLCVFCGSQSGTRPAYLESARATGRLLAGRGIRLVYGGGSAGMMGAVADACLEAGGEVIGVIPAFLMDLELGHRGVTKLEVVSTMLERKTRMAELSDAFITLPGFLFFYFWEGAGLMISSLIGFLIGSFVLSTLEVIGPLVAAIRRVFRDPAKSEAPQTESQHGIDDA